MTWQNLQSKIVPYVVRIETQHGTGTGFFFAYNPAGTLAAIATAAHVIEEAHEWKQPIRLIHGESGTVSFVDEGNRVIFIDKKRDAATILVKKNSLPFPEKGLQLMDPTKYKSVGVELGWIGFPSVAYPNLCFFSGRTSCFLFSEDCYLIDGVAINGVSGGPVFFEKDEQPEIVGIISAYISNRAGNTPGLLRAQDITPYADVLKTLQSLHDAKQKEKTLDEAAAKDAQPPSADETYPSSASDLPEKISLRST
jgi:hypothetical protein